ncbi:hypothetical protein [Phaeospirillum tilakii]|uniref:Uncharacterized protein n=1 Tax=Phaeospirillum tilakii TaxID=741673 RepID=A0ABW5CAD8_9PROT
MDVSSPGNANTQLYLPQAQQGLEGPYSPDKLQQTVAQVQTQLPTAALQQAQQAQSQPVQPLSDSKDSQGSLGQALDITA